MSILINVPKLSIEYNFELIAYYIFNYTYSLNISHLIFIFIKETAVLFIQNNNLKTAVVLFTIPL